MSGRRHRASRTLRGERDPGKRLRGQLDPDQLDPSWTWSVLALGYSVPSGFNSRYTPLPRVGRLIPDSTHDSRCDSDQRCGQLVHERRRAQATAFRRQRDHVLGQPVMPIIRIWLCLRCANLSTPASIALLATCFQGGMSAMPPSSCAQECNRRPHARGARPRTATGSLEVYLQSLGAGWKVIAGSRD